jgi:hypothetical protein
VVAEERFHMTDAHNQVVMVQTVIQQLQGVHDQILQKYSEILNAENYV